MAFENGVVSENWRFAVIVPLYKDKGKRIEFRNYRGISLLSVIEKIYAEVLVDRVCKVTDDEQGHFRSWRGV